MRFVSVGDNCIDYYDDLGLMYPTGNAVDVAIQLDRLGVEESVFIGTIATDDYGDWIYDALSNEGVNLELATRAMGKTAIARLSLVDGECEHLEYDPGIQKIVKYSDEQIQYMSSADVVHSTPWGGLSQWLPVLHNKSCLVSYDFSDRYNQPSIIELFKYVDIAFFSMADDVSSANEVLSRANGQGVRVAIATLGPKGCRACVDGVYFQSAAYKPKKISNTVGAGDSFVAGFLSCYTPESDVLECLGAAAAVSADTIAHFGPWPGAPVRSL